MKMLVTGGAGFIGSHVARELLSDGHEVIILDDLSGGMRDNVPDGALFVVGSILDDGLVNELFDLHRFDCVYHLAAYAAEGLSHFIQRFNYQNNLVGSVNLINAAVNTDVRCFVFTSSIAVYGKNQLPLHEDLAPQPDDPYGIAKFAVEQQLRSTQKVMGLNHVIFRPHNVYGENQNIGDKYRNVVGIFMNQIMQGRPLTIFGDGLQTRAFSYVEPVAKTIAQAPFVRGALNDVFNIGGDEVITVRDLALEVSRVFGVEPKINYLPPRHEVVHAYASHEKANRVFGQAAEIGFHEGLLRMAEWARRVGPRTTRPFGFVEVQKNMPEAWLDVVATHEEA